jgi:hypothetical protein
MKAVLDFSPKVKLCALLNYSYPSKMGNINTTYPLFLLNSLWRAGNGPFLNTNYGASPSWLESPFIPGWVGSLRVYASNLWTGKFKINMRLLKEQIFSLHELFSMYYSNPHEFSEEVHIIIAYQFFQFAEPNSARQNVKIRGTVDVKLAKMSEREREVQCRSVPQPLCSQTIIL